MKVMTRLILSAYREKYRTQKEIDRLQLEIEAVEVEMSGLAHHGTEMTPEQAKSDKPMPHTVSPTSTDSKLLALIARKDDLESQIDSLEMSKMLARKVDLLAFRDREMLRELYHSRKNAEQVAAEYGYKVSPMYRHLYAEIDKLT